MALGKKIRNPCYPPLAAGQPEWVSALALSLADFADRPWRGSSDPDEVSRALDDGNDSGNRDSVAKVFVSMCISDKSFDEMQSVLSEIILRHKGERVIKVAQRKLNQLHRLENLSDFSAANPRSIPDLDTLFANLNNPKEAWKVAHGLRYLRDRRAIEPLLSWIHYYIGLSLNDRKNAKYVARDVLDALGGMQVHLPIEEMGPIFETLSYINDARTVDMLLDALNDRWDHVKNEAVFILGVIGDPSAVEPLLILFGQHKKLPLRERFLDALPVTIVKSLRMFGNSIPIDQLITMFEEEMMPPGESIGDIIRFARHDGLACAFAETLGTAKDRRIVNSLKKAIMIASGDLLEWMAENELAQLTKISS